ncbi:MAG TPA: hypothetical protein VFS20_19615 [Longimicrobium sp.]|nr:hypothetical protein [Longimicrobium sp.]
MRSLDSMTRTFRRAILALGCGLALGACTTWVEAPTPAPAPDALRKFSSTIRVVQHDGSSVRLRNAYVTGDTPYGHHSGASMAIPLHEVRATRRRELDPFRGFGVLAVGAVVAFGVYVFGTIIPVGGS